MAYRQTPEGLVQTSGTKAFTEVQTANAELVAQGAVTQGDLTCGKPATVQTTIAATAAEEVLDETV